MNLKIEKYKLWTLLPIVFFGVLVDQISKKWALSSLKGEPTIEYLGGLIQLIYAENKGAFGSMGSGLSEEWRFWLLTIAPIAFLIAVTIHLLFKSDASKTEFLAFSLIISGGVGNLIDRALYGYVVDFLYMEFITIGTYTVGTNIFNVADMIIVLGTVFLVKEIISAVKKGKAKSGSSASIEQQSNSKNQLASSSSDS